MPKPPHGSGFILVDIGPQFGFSEPGYPSLNARPVIEEGAVGAVTGATVERSVVECKRCCALNAAPAARAEAVTQIIPRPRLRAKKRDGVLRLLGIPARGSFMQDILSAVLSMDQNRGAAQPSLGKGDPL